MAKVSKGLRRALAEAQNWRCAYCAAVLEADGPTLATAEHIVPSGAGGREARLNLVSACLACNGARGADIDAWTFWKLRQRLLDAGLWPAGERPCQEVANLLRTHRAYVRAKIALRRRFRAAPAAATNLLLEDLVDALNDGCALTALQITRLRPAGGGCRYRLPRSGGLGLADAERADWDCLWDPLGHTSPGAEAMG